METITYLPPLRTAVALAGTLIVAFVLCAIVQAILPGPQFSHMWLQLFTAAPLGSVRCSVELIGRPRTRRSFRASSA